MNIVHLDSVDSTNNWCRAHANELPVCVVAAEQTAGRGRYGKSFHSPVGGVYMSYAFRSAFTPENVQNVTLAVGAIVHQVLQSHCNAELSIKWVNDILMGKRKIAGILSEYVDRSEDCDEPYIIVGVGVNVLRYDVPTELEGIVGFLSDSNPSYDCPSGEEQSIQPAALADELAAALDSVFGNGDADLNKILKYIDYYKDKCYNCEHITEK